MYTISATGVLQLISRIFMISIYESTVYHLQKKALNKKEAKKWQFET